MKKLIVFAITFVFGFTSFGQDDPVIMTIDGKEITKTEFLQIYLKNNDDPKYDQQSLDEYMELFVKFKLKVAEAEDLGYDTIPKLVKELDGYKRQLSLPYLVDSMKTEALVREAYDRTKMEVRASHILVKVSPKATAADTLRAYNRCLDLRKRILAGEDFATVAKSRGGSEDPSAQSNGGDLGYFTAFQMVYPFEDNAFKTEVGDISMPFRTRFGYHIVKVVDKRQARGTIETAHIMVAARESEGPASIESARKRIDEIYNQLKEGGDFEELVRKYSDDPSSSDKGGRLPAFGTGTTTRMVQSFEDAAFALKNDGDFSQPVQTSYGFHIVKRIEWTDVPSFEDLRTNLESRVAKDERSQQTQSSFVSKLKKEYKFKSKKKKGLKWFYKNVDSTYFNGAFSADQLKKSKPLFKMDKQKFGQRSFAEHLESAQRGLRKESDMQVVIDQQYAIWEKNTILDYERSRLADKYPAYKALITEYHDGILLYEVMSDMVWNKAMKDTTGLQEFFKSNEANYMWGERLDADVFECNLRENAEKVYALMQNDTLTIADITTIVNESNPLNTKHKSGKFDINKSRFVKDQDLKKGLNPIYENGGKFYVVRVNEVLPPAQKEFNEAKGAITSDYQSHLETEWIKELRKKHTVVINKEALYSLGK